MHNQYLRTILLATAILLPVVSIAEDSIPLPSTPIPTKIDQVIVQIGGRFCEYLPQKVEAALYGFHPVQRVEFLNGHGTLLVQYDSDRVSPEQLVSSVEGAVSSGIGCRAWVDRGNRLSKG